MSGTEDTSVAASVVVAEEGNQENNADVIAAATAAKLSGETDVPAAPPQLSPRFHPEESVAYITVSDPVQHTEGIKGKFTMYRVAYDPPPPAADADVVAAGEVTVGNAGGATNRALFPYATSVNRRYSDFSWLFEHLHKERPGAIVPPLPEKQQASRFSESFIEERRFHLEIFLRRVVRNPELIDTECLLVFLGGGDAEFKKAKRGGSFGAAAVGSPRSASDSRDDEYDDGAESPNEQENSGTLVGKGKERLIHKKAGIKKWIKERKTNMQGTLVRSPDDAVFEEATHFVSALEAGLKRVEAQASAMVRRERDVSSCLLEFGLGCDALAHVDDTIGGGGNDARGGTGEDDGGGEEEEEAEGSSGSGVAQTFCLVGKTAVALWALSMEHHERELRRFAEPLRDHLKMVHVAKVALVKRNNRRITYSTCLNAVDSKKASLHRYRITPGQEGKAVGVESSLSRAEQSVVAARANYEEVSARVLREVDRFRRENAVAMYATMADFARMQKEHADRVSEAWGALVPLVENVDAARLEGTSFVQAAETMRQGGRSSRSVVAAGG
eukprot:CAMPEP_0172529960 /NCGR_PEP_ID=MMETSP1067-20121228/3871_1 /TAXON_ID=265564 ORGANISM="Thalassiosira punctigera, Strain Tpunct2005C2" /NCGR_SAMPLE_ID=MMETSP1067 /ASSEMBLY_ACC=CAM_ASM_000444 /LENGTH=557 /DNA_ID=CAMNT_0013314099 /DNA_START=150 /DNA_END=1820 /DNA_ORIENTATION=-